MHQKSSIGNGERGVWWKVSALIEEVHWLFHSWSYLSSVLVPLLFFWVKILNSLGFLLYFLFFFFWQVRNCYKRKSFSKCISRALLKAGSSRLFSFCWLHESLTHSLYASWAWAYQQLCKGNSFWQCYAQRTIWEKEVKYENKKELTTKEFIIS